jgi:hypothetical protein
MKTLDTNLDLRNRQTNKKSSDLISENEIDAKKQDVRLTQYSQSVYTWSYFLFGVFLMLWTGKKYSIYLKTLHENTLWFSNLTVISFDLIVRFLTVYLKKKVFQGS